MSKIYIVTDGCYSDYHIVAAFSTREKADEYVHECTDMQVYFNDDMKVEEYDIDTETPPKRKTTLYVVQFNHNWEFVDFEFGYPPPLDYLDKEVIFAMAKDEEHYPKYFVGVFADGREKAQRIAQERVAATKAVIDTHLPELKNINIPTGSYPYKVRSVIYEWGGYRVVAK